jgi:hypothetical protein
MALGDPQFGKTINRLREENETLKAKVETLLEMLDNAQAEVRRLGGCRSCGGTKMVAARWKEEGAPWRRCLCPCVLLDDDDPAE